MLSWLIEGGLGPAVVALPVNWAGEALAEATQRWFRRLHRTDDLSRLLKSATGTSVGLSRAEFDDVRRLLEDPQTWSVAGRGTVGDLATRIASCLPAREGRTAGDSHAAALIIARGVLEFAAADLDPKLFQQLLLARLQRMEIGLGGELDGALLGLHSDLIARLAAQGELDNRRFAEVMGHLKRVLDQLPPGPANRGEITVYLRTLIDWVNTDPWPRDQRFAGPVLTPADIERKLLVTANGRVREEDLDADRLAQRCQRLVILGGPGTGKTWLAKRTARRCAEQALEALASGAALDEVEVPLYTTCSRLFSADGDIREAVVSSALAQLGDLGGSRLSRAVRVFFTERNASTVLVIDSLDEAPGSDERLRQADTLPWRIVLTSRPSSWNHQLGIGTGSDSHRVVELQPLTYPDDIESFIHCWFQGQPQLGSDLTARIARRPSLQKAATVPLILAFYCIIGGGGEPLPDLRRDLYLRVIRRMLTGRWRGSHDSRPDVSACFRVLRSWAWSGAVDNPGSGTGNWADDIPAEDPGLGSADQEALDHIATPLGPPDVDTGMTLRRFVHRSLREYLVAEHVAGLPVDQAADVLLPHLWYDPDWEYSAPAAIAMHPHRDRPLRDLTCRAARSGQIPENLSVIDAGFEFRGLLARIAAESGSADWSAEIAEIISRALVELARASRTDHLGAASHWEPSVRQVVGALLELLDGQPDGWLVARLARTLTQLNPTAADEGQARNDLIRLLPNQPYRWQALDIVVELVKLHPAAEEKRQARDSLLSLPPASSEDEWVVDGIVQLALTAQEKREASAALLELLGNAVREAGEIPAEWVSGVVRLAITREDQLQASHDLTRLLDAGAGAWMISRLADGVILLDPPVEDRRRVCDALLRPLRGQSIGSHDCERLVRCVVRLAVTPAEKRESRDALLTVLAVRASRETDDYYGLVARELVEGLVQLAGTPEDKHQVREALRGLADHADSPVAGRMMNGVAQLAATAEEKREARDALLELLGNQTADGVAALMVRWVIRLATGQQCKNQARKALLRLLRDKVDDSPSALAAGIVELDPTAEDKHQVCQALLRLIVSGHFLSSSYGLVRTFTQCDPASQDKHQVLDAALRSLSKGRSINAAVGVVLLLNPAEEDKRHARETVLGVLAGQNDPMNVEDLLKGLMRLAPAVEERRQARDAALRLLASLPQARAIHQIYAGKLVEKMIELAQTAQEKREARDALLELAASQVDSWETDDPYGEVAEGLVGGITQLVTTAEEVRQARDALRGMLTGQARGRFAACVMDAMAELAPTVNDLSVWRAWTAPPSARLLAATRRNSALAAWTAALPSLTPLSS